MEKKVKRDGLQEFDTVVRDVKAQFAEQQRLIDQRVEQQNLLLTEMADFCKKRGEIEAQYANALDKLLRRQRPTTANSAVSRTWQSLLESTRKMRDGHLLFANNFSHKMGEYLNELISNFPSLLKRYRELHNGLQQDEVGRLKVYREKLEAYRTAYNRLVEDRAKWNKCSSKMNANQTTGTPASESQAGTGTTKKERDLARALKVLEESTQKATSTRNEYLLAVASENVALDRLLNTDFAFATFYVHWFFRKTLARAFRFALVGDTYSSLVQRCEDTLRSSIDELDAQDLPFPECATSDAYNILPTGAANGDTAAEVNVRTVVEQLSSQSDYRALLEHASTAFTPRSLAFEAHRDDTEKTVRADSDSVGAVLMRVCSGCREALSENRMRIERLVGEMQRLKHELTLQLSEPLDEQFSPITVGTNASAFGEGYGPSPNEAGSLDSLTQPFSVLNSPSSSAVAQAISRKAQETFSISDVMLVKQREYFTFERNFAIVRAKLSQIEPVLRQFGTPSSTFRPNIARANATSNKSGTRPRRDVFGVRLIDYVELNRESIPTVLRSCIRFLTDNALHHPGVFRISGSQTEVLELRARFNSGDDPLEANVASTDVNSVASLLKLYLRELPEPLLPPSVAHNLVELRTAHQNDELHLRAELCAALKAGVPHAHYVVLRYLFAFLNHVTAYDENMMDAHNLAVCFGPTVTQPLSESERDHSASSNGFAPSSGSTPAPVHSVSESTDLVSKQRNINEMIADLIVNYSEVFDVENISGPLYSPSAVTEDAENAGTLPRPSVSTAPHNTGTLSSEGTVVFMRSTSLDQTVVNTDNRASVFSTDSNSLNDANDDPSSLAGTAIPQPQQSDSNSNSNFSDSLSGANNREADDAASLSDGSKSAIAQKAGVFFRERVSDAGLQSRPTVPDEPSVNPRQVTVTPTAPTLHYSVSAPRSQVSSLNARPNAYKQTSFDSPPQNQVEITSSKLQDTPTTVSIASETTKPPPDKVLLSAVTPPESASERSQSPARMHEDHTASPRTARLVFTGGDASLGRVAGIRGPAVGTTPLLKAVTVLNASQPVEQVDVGESDSVKRPPPVARKPVVIKK